MSRPTREGLQIGDVEWNFEPVDVAEVAESVVESYRAHADSRQLELRTDPGGISDLSGVDQLTSLTVLQVDHNDVSDLAPLADIERAVMKRDRERVLVLPPQILEHHFGL